MMKKVLAYLLIALLLTSCAQAPEPVPAPEPDAACTARELASAALQGSNRDPSLSLEELSAPDGRLSVYIEAVTGLTSGQWEDAAVIRGTGASAFEIIALCLPDADAAASLEAVLTDYLTAREGAFTGYAPAEASMAASGKILRKGRTVGLFICPDPDSAAELFTAAYNGEELPAPPEPVSEPEPKPASAPEPLVIPVQDVLHRLLLEAACPEWRSIRKVWSTSSDGRSVVANWMPDDSNEPLLRVHADDPLLMGVSYQVSVHLRSSEEEAAELAEALNRQLEELREYGGEEMAALLEKGCAVSSGCYAALIISERMEDAALLFPRVVNDPGTAGYFERVYIEGSQVVITDPDPDYPDRTRFTPPNEEDMSIYDTSAILAAWESSDPSALTGDDREIYAAAESILSGIIQDGMTDLEKETAAYRWLVDSVNYDWTHQDVLAETARRSYGPYGGLVSRTAVCLGYATSFQLLMDMSGVECITITGAAARSTGDHAWNMVKLNGEWYCVDVTWDANGREQLGDAYTAWRYFNITSDEMAKNHQWDYASTPEATATDRGQG